MGQSQEAFIEPRLLVWARESAGYELHEAATLFEINSATLSAWEAGDQRPTIASLREASRIYRRPLAVFFLPTPPTDFDVPHDYRKHAGSKSRRMSPELRAEIRRLQFLREVALDVAEAIEAEPAEFIGSATLDIDAEVVAASSRARLNLGLTTQVNRWSTPTEALKACRTAVEGSGVLVFQVQNVDTSEMRGFSVRELQFPIIALNSKDAPAARLFTLFHEFGHLLLNQAGLCDLSDEGRASSQDQRAEVFCNAFAGELLVPREALLVEIGIKRVSRTRSWDDDEIRTLAQRFCVSREVIARRLVTIGAASREFYSAKRAQYLVEAADDRNERSGGPSPAVRSVWNVGGEFARIVIDAHDREAISSSSLCEYLGVRSRHFEQVRELAFGLRPAKGVAE